MTGQQTDSRRTDLRPAVDGITVWTSGPWPGVLHGAAG